MKQFIQAWRSSILSESNPLLLNEGLFDIGLPAAVAEAINRNFDGVPEKGKTMIGNIFKIQQFKRLPSGYARSLLNDSHNYITQMKEIGINLVNEEGSLGWQQFPLELRQDFLQLWHNLEVIITGNEDGIDQEGNNWFATTLGDIQRASKMMKKAFKKGSYAKAAGKELDPDIIDSMDSFIYDNYARMIGETTLAVQAWLKSQKDEYKKIPEIVKESNYFPLAALIRYAQNWQNDVEKEDQKFHTFDDTSYWYDLEAASCDIEAERMGHCGGDSRAETLFSLRYKPKGKQRSSSYITVAYNADDNIIYQIKGKFNKAPEEKFYKHIAWLIQALGDPKVSETGEHSDDKPGFEKMSKWLQDNTDADIAEVQDPRVLMEDEINSMKNYYNDQYYYAEIEAEMADPRGLVDPNTPAYYMRGIVGVPILLSELTEEALQKVYNDRVWPTGEQLERIATLMDYPEASGKIYGDEVVDQAVRLRTDDIVFYFYVADRITAGGQMGTWIFSENIDDLASFAGDILDMDRDVTIEGNKIQEDLRRALISVGLVGGGPFLSLFLGARDGVLQQNSDWIVETDTYGGEDDEPKLVWIQTPLINLDLKRLERDGVGEEYYRKPQVVEKILNSNTFKKHFMEQLSANAMVSDTIMPSIQGWDVNLERSNSPSFVIEAAWAVHETSNERISEVMSRWLAEGYGKSDFEDMLHIAYYRTMNEAFGDDAASSQASMDFPGGKRLSVNESFSHKDIVKKWKGFKGF